MNGDGPICPLCMSANAERLDYNERGLTWDLHEHMQRHARRTSELHQELGFNNNPRQTSKQRIRPPQGAETKDRDIGRSRSSRSAA